MAKKKVEPLRGGDEVVAPAQGNVGRHPHSVVIAIMGEDALIWQYPEGDIHKGDAFWTKTAGLRRAA